jgi:DNA topoisomerase VI subunit B
MSAHILERITFQTSRLLDFCSPKELTAQTGHPPEEWPFVIGKELLDNSIDACEEGDEEGSINPCIGVVVDDKGITVADNGPGIPPKTIEGVLQFDVRVSSREAYVSPCRGAQGNALKTLVAMPFVLDGQEGRVEVRSRGIRHHILFRVDRIAQRPVIDYAPQPDEGAEKGTTFYIAWPPQHRAMLEKMRERFVTLLHDFTFLNPHLSLAVDWFGQTQFTTESTTTDWKKWRPNQPTSAHWYTHEQAERLVGAYITHDNESGGEEGGRTVRAFIEDFDGFKGSAAQKKVLDATGLSRSKLADLTENGRMRSEAIAALFQAMKDHSKAVTHDRLGSIGKDHLASCLRGLGCEMESFKYKAVKQNTGDGLPWVLETAFGWCPRLKGRRLITGVNWSAGIINPFRTLGRIGTSLDYLLASQRIHANDPIALVVHAACPRVAYQDRGKSAVVIGTAAG